MSASRKTLVIGGGITGLTAAWRLHSAGHRVELLEAGSRVGGMIRTENIDGFLAELGPNTLQENRAETAELLKDLGLDDQRVYAGSVSKNRYILRNGKPVPLPLSPVSLFFGGFFRPSTRLRLLGEPFIRRAPGDTVETMETFVRRRLGQELLDYAVNPFVAGTFAARPPDLAVRYAFPRLHRMEQEHGSLVKGALFGKRHKPEGGRGIFSFKDGLQAIPNALAGRLGGAIHTGTRAVALEKDEKWKATAERNGESLRIEADTILLALPPQALGDIRITGRSLEERLSLAARLPAPPLSVLFLGYRRDQVRHPLDGFGMLVPEKENRKILGALFSSSLFTGRAPDGHVSLTVFIGGSRQPELATKPLPELERLVRGELKELFGVEGEPCVIRHTLWPRVIPHYTVDHGKLIDDLDALESEHRGLHIGGPVRQGVALGDCIASGFGLAGKVLEKPNG